MSESDSRSNAAEYVLGTLDVAERAAFERDMAGDAGLRAEVAQWESWLAGLNDVIPEIVPPAGLWAAIQRRIRPSSPTRPVASAPVVDLAAIQRSRSRWRVSALAFGAVAAGLALFVARDRLQPVAPAPSYLAVVNRGGDLPALVVHVDTATDTVSIRSVAAETPPDRVLELWLVAGGRAPRSIGLLDRPETRVALPAVARGDDLAGATLAVSVEPRGGSPTGAPTGQVVYSGQLFRDR